MTPRKPKKTADPFPPLTCGACYYCRSVDDHLMCFVSPPILHGEGSAIGWLRGAPINGTEPECGQFKARMHA